MDWQASFLNYLCRAFLLPKINQFFCVLEIKILSIWAYLDILDLHEVVLIVVVILKVGSDLFLREIRLRHFFFGFVVFDKFSPRARELYTCRLIDATAHWVSHEWLFSNKKINLSIFVIFFWNQKNLETPKKTYFCVKICKSCSQSVLAIFACLQISYMQCVT